VAKLIVREFGGIRIDSRQWPLVTFDQPEHKVTDAATMEALDFLTGLMGDVGPREKIFLLVDLSQSKEAAPASQRKAAAQHSARHEELQKRTVVGSGIVITSAVMRGVITAVFWIRPPSIPTKLVASRDEALRYGLDLLEAHLSMLPPNLQQLRNQVRRAG
jgi:hypothetical protein